MIWSSNDHSLTKIVLRVRETQTHSIPFIGDPCTRARHSPQPPRWNSLASCDERNFHLSIFILGTALDLDTIQRCCPISADCSDEGLTQAATSTPALDSSINLVENGEARLLDSTLSADADAQFGAQRASFVRGGARVVIDLNQ